MGTIKVITNLKDRILNKKIEIPNKVILDIEDICLELTDIGYNILIIELGFDTCPPYMEIFFGQEEDFYYEEVQEVVERITDYMKISGYSTEVEQTSRKIGKYMKAFWAISNVKLIFKPIN